jgi:hypothetical protein
MPDISCGIKIIFRVDLLSANLKYEDYTAGKKTFRKLHILEVRRRELTG